MKLDSEAQREQLVLFLSEVEFTVTAKTVQHTADTIFGLINTVQKAGLDKPIVPIESLAPDPPDLKVEDGGQ